MFGLSRKSVEKAKRMIELTNEIVMLKIEKADLEIKIERQKEEYERNDLEIKHMIGLERKRMEQEVNNSKREAVLAAKEENLSADKARFETSMKFREEQFKSEMQRMEGFLREITERLPNVNVELKKIGR